MKYTSLVIAAGVAVAGIQEVTAMSSSSKARKITSSQAAIPSTIIKEAKSSIKRGVQFLTNRQKSNGSWLDSPAITGLCLISLYQSNVKGRLDATAKARAFILKNVRKDGAICPANRKYINYSTSVCLAALAIMNNPKDVQVMRNARNFLIGLQLNENNKKNPTGKDNKFYGGIGYGSGGPKRPDLSNTQWALEALYLTEHLNEEGKGGSKAEKKKSEIAWKNAILFLKRVQKVPESADANWVVTAKNDGGFIYKPGDSKASSKYKDNKTLRSYGSMTYAGLKSMIYANLKKDDYRVKAAMAWAKKNYTLKENPGMGGEGRFYYIHTFAKAHAAYGSEVIKTSDGKKRSWRKDVILTLLREQRSKGEWYNSTGRWRESIPEVVTAYALSSMEIALGNELYRDVK